jgi:hypothetical protein
MKYFMIPILMAILLCMRYNAMAQVSITPLPARSAAFRMEDIWQVSILNLGSAPLSGNLFVTISEGSGTSVISIAVPNVRLAAGANALNRLSNKEASVDYGPGSKSSTLRRTGALPYGEYILCYFFKDPGAGTVLGEYCYEKTVQPVLPPELIQPADGEAVNTVFPVLVWKGPFPPGDSPVSYALRLVEVLPGQSAAAALERNRPLLSRRYKNMTQLVYPADAPALSAQKTYAWQVAAFSDDYNLGTTEIWTFQVETPENNIIPPKKIAQAYREVKLSPDGSYYPAKGRLQFMYDNRYQAWALQYGKDIAGGLSVAIYPAGNREKALRIDNFPEIKLIGGANMLNIDLSAVSGIVSGSDYLMVLRDPVGKEYFLEFTYFN